MSARLYVAEPAARLCDISRHGERVPVYVLAEWCQAEWGAGVYPDSRAGWDIDPVSRDLRGRPVELTADDLEDVDQQLMERMGSDTWEE